MTIIDLRERVSYEHDMRPAPDRRRTDRRSQRGPVWLALPAALVVVLVLAVGWWLAS